MSATIGIWQRALGRLRGDLLGLGVPLAISIVLAWFAVSASSIVVAILSPIILGIVGNMDHAIAVVQTIVAICVIGAVAIVQAGTVRNMLYPFGEAPDGMQARCIPVAVLLGGITWFAGVQLGGGLPAVAMMVIVGWLLTLSIVHLVQHEDSALGLGAAVQIAREFPATFLLTILGTGCIAGAVGMAASMVSQYLLLLVYVPALLVTMATAIELYALVHELPAERVERELLERREPDASQATPARTRSPLLSGRPTLDTQSAYGAGCWVSPDGVVSGSLTISVTADDVPHMPSGVYVAGANGTWVELPAIGPARWCATMPAGPWFVVLAGVPSGSSFSWQLEPAEAAGVAA